MCRCLAHVVIYTSSELYCCFISQLVADTSRPSFPSTISNLAVLVLIVYDELEKSRNIDYFLGVSISLFPL